MRVLFENSELSGEEVGDEERSRDFVLADEGCGDEVLLHVEAHFRSALREAAAREISGLLSEVHGVKAEAGALESPAREGARRSLWSHHAEIVGEIAVHGVRKDQVDERAGEDGAGSSVARGTGVGIRGFPFGSSVEKRPR